MISQIVLKKVRCFEKISFNITNKNVIITGLNATGKTTILEAITLASLTKSHRTNNLKEIIQQNADFADISITNNQKDYRVVLTEKGKMVKINETEIKKISDYIGEFPTVFFSPYDLDLITSSPLIRRKFLNQEISQLDSIYLKQLNAYNQLLHERNACLKEMHENSDLTYLKVLTNELISLAKPLISARMQFVKQINDVINTYHQKLKLSENITLLYKPSLDLTNFEKLMMSKLYSDLNNKVTQYGPHKDDLVFLINENPLNQFGSQGQIRSVVLSLKLSICEILKNKNGSYPILLLDDVLSELDSLRQNNLLEIIQDFGQIFITAADTSALMDKNLNKYQIIRL